jgi:hypothetical protein
MLKRETHKFSTSPPNHEKFIPWQRVLASVPLCAIATTQVLDSARGFAGDDSGTTKRNVSFCSQEHCAAVDPHVLQLERRHHNFLDSGSMCKPEPLGLILERKMTLSLVEHSKLDDL